MSLLSNMSSTLIASTMLVGISTLPAAGQDSAKLEIVASFSILGDFAKQIAGDRITISTLVGPGEDAHVYEPTPADAARVAKADLVIINGLQFEGFIERLIEASGTKATIVTATKGVKPLKAGEHDEDEHDDHDDHKEHGHSEEKHHDDDHAKEGDDHHHHGEYDPHAWHSFDNAKIYVTTISEGLCAADAEGCGTYLANAEAYIGKLNDLQTTVDATLAAIPEDKRTIIVSHDAFGYLADAYGLTLLAPIGLSTESEASAADVAKLIDQIRKDGASALFVENVADPRLIERISAETGLSVGGTLYSDALSESNGPAATYLDMMRHNVTTIAGAINGS